MSKTPLTDACLGNGKKTIGQIRCDLEDLCRELERSLAESRATLEALEGKAVEPVKEQLTHARSCPQLARPLDGDCTCGLEFRIREQTALEISAAWRKRAMEAESQAAALQDKLTAALTAAEEVQAGTFTRAADACARAIEAERDSALSREPKE